VNTKNTLCLIRSFKTTSGIAGFAYIAANQYDRTMFIVAHFCAQKHRWIYWSKAGKTKQQDLPLHGLEP
jgi:hypothetical protein